MRCYNPSMCLPQLVDIDLSSSQSKKVGSPHFYDLILKGTIFIEDSKLGNTNLKRFNLKGKKRNWLSLGTWTI